MKAMFIKGIEFGCMMVHVNTENGFESLSRRFHLDNNFDECNIGRSEKA